MPKRVQRLLVGNQLKPIVTLLDTIGMRLKWDYPSLPSPPYPSPFSLPLFHFFCLGKNNETGTRAEVPNNCRISSVFRFPKVVGIDLT